MLGSPLEGNKEQLCRRSCDTGVSPKTKRVIPSRNGGRRKTNGSVKADLCSLLLMAPQEYSRISELMVTWYRKLDLGLGFQKHSGNTAESPYTHGTSVALNEGLLALTMSGQRSEPLHPFSHYREVSGTLVPRQGGRQDIQKYQ